MTGASETSSTLREFRRRGGETRRNGQSARAYVESLFAQGYDCETIERRVLQRQNSLDWDIPAPPPFRLDGIKKESERIRVLVSEYASNWFSLDEQGLLGGVEAFTSFFEDDNLWFSENNTNVSSKVGYISPSRLHAEPFDKTWELVEAMAYGIAWKLIEREGHLDRHDLQDLIQAGRIAAWECTRTYDGVRAKYSTYVHKAMFNAMKDHSDFVKPSDELDWFGRDGQTEDFADPLCGFLTLISVLQDIQDGHLLVAGALGLHEAEMQETNLRVRRFRAKNQLNTMLQRVI